MAKIHFEWKKEYSVNVKILDQQHQRLFKIIDDLLQYISVAGSKEKLPEIFKELNKYTSEHFATEEAYFKITNFESAVEHKALHDKFKKDISEMESKVNDEDFNVMDLLSYLEKWWIEHILDADKRYVKNLNEHGFK